jgi:itaconyl-CoA hydratase
MDERREGNFFEDFVVGQVFRHALGRTINDADNTWFTLLTCNPNPIHFNADYASRTEFGRPLVNSAFTLALVTGLSVADVSRHAVANLGWDAVRLPAPVFVGDTIYAESEVLETRPSRSRPGQGVVRVHTRGYRADGTVVIEFERAVLVYARDRSPDDGRPSPRENRSTTPATPTRRESR